MRVLRTTAAILATVLALSGCGLLAPAQIPVSQSQPVAVQEVQKAINEANVLIAAAANVVAGNVKDGVLTKAEGAAYVVQLEALAKKSDQAQTLLAGGNILSAKNQAELLSAAILALHREVASRRKQ